MYLSAITIPHRKTINTAVHKDNRAITGLRNNQIKMLSNQQNKSE